MTRKDYRLIAKTIKDINARKAKGDRIIELFAEALQVENPKFNKDIFIKACNTPLK